MKYLIIVLAVIVILLPIKSQDISMVWGTIDFESRGSINILTE